MPKDHKEWVEKRMIIPGAPEILAEGRKGVGLGPITPANTKPPSDNQFAPKQPTQDLTQKD